MNVLDFNEKALRRKQHNKKVLKKMEKGESLSSFNSQSSWFPPRPIIKKDKKAVEKLYKNTPSFSLRNKRDNASCKLLPLSFRSC